MGADKDPEDTAAPASGTSPAAANTGEAAAAANIAEGPVARTAAEVDTVAHPVVAGAVAAVADTAAPAAAVVVAVAGIAAEAAEPVPERLPEPAESRTGIPSSRVELRGHSESRPS
jgi:hypothetical protein